MYVFLCERGRGQGGAGEELQLGARHLCVCVIYTNKEHGASSTESRTRILKKRFLCHQDSRGLRSSYKLVD